MPRLYLVRHGETHYNLEGRIQGQLDSDLTELGTRQAEAIARRLASESFAAIYSSDLGRAVSTAAVVAEGRAVRVQTTPLLREASFGVVEGLTRDEVEARFPADQYEWRRMAWSGARPPGAETWEQVVDRCREFLAIAGGTCAASGDILVIGHGGSVRGLIVAALSFPIAVYRAIHLGNASLSIIELGERPSLWLLNDTCHLDSLVSAREDAESSQ